MTELAADWPQQYHAWWNACRELVAAHEWKAAFRSYPWPTFTTAPWTALPKPLAESRVALISSSGVTAVGQPPFDENILEGDPTWRIIATGNPLAAWTIRHGHYDPTAALKDYNTVFPLDVLRSLAKDGVIGDVAPRAISFIGFQTDAKRVLHEWAPRFAQILREDAVDAVLLVPV